MGSFSLQYVRVDGLAGGLPGLEPPRAAASGPHLVVPLVVSLIDESRATVGGLMGATYGEWLMTQMVWLPEGARGQGYGRRLLALAEDEALRRGCRQAFVESCCRTHLPFFERCGYALQTRLPGFAGADGARGLVKALA